MPSHPVRAVTLACHPETPSNAVHSVDAQVCRTPQGTLAVTYVLEGALERLRVPAPRPPRIAHRLWEHTCCEIFIAAKGRPGYHEFNLSPSGEWAVHAFERYRKGAPLSDPPDAEGLAPRIAVRNAAGRMELDAVVRLDRLSSLHLTASLSLALSAVVEDSEGLLSYWALTHPPGRPDFHHAEAFALELGT